MPLIDFNKNPNFSSNDFDFTIIGAGAAGIMLALKLARSGSRVLIIESGHFSEDDQRQILNEVVQSAKHLTNAKWGRKRAIGGTTIAWGGQSLPFKEIDFKKRDWIDNSGWPISFEELKPFYQEANEFMGIDSMDYENDILKLFRMQNPIKSEVVDYHFSKWAPQPNFFIKNKAELVNNTTIIYNAVLARIDCDNDGKAKNIQLKNFNEDTTSIDVKELILCVGAIEACRTLLLNNHQFEKSIGNTHGWVGKCFMDHPCVDVGKISTTDEKTLQRAFNTHIDLRTKRKYSVRLTLNDAIQEQKKLVNASASIMFVTNNNMFALVKKVNLASIKKILRYLPVFFETIVELARKKHPYKPKAEAVLCIMCEQEPIAESYISLDEETDRFGMKKAKINWKITEKTWYTINELTKSCKLVLKQNKLGNLEVYPKITLNNINWDKEVNDVNHHMGGTRMSKIAQEGVVDTNLQVWNHPNIYVCAASVFPTGSHSNPTLTLLALTARLAKFLSNNKR